MGYKAKLGRMLATTHPSPASSMHSMFVLNRKSAECNTHPDSHVYICTQGYCYRLQISLPESEPVKSNQPGWIPRPWLILPDLISVQASQHSLVPRLDFLPNTYKLTKLYSNILQWPSKLATQEYNVLFPLILFHCTDSGLCFVQNYLHL